MQPLSRLVIAVAALVMATTVGCTHGNDYYDREPYPNGTTIDSGLAQAEREVADAISSGDAASVLTDRTAPPWRHEMVRFLRGYAGHRAVVTRMSPGDDATADETLAVTCGPGDVQHVGLTWGWFDDAWRAWPDYAVNAKGDSVPYPGCR